MGCDIGGQGVAHAEDVSDRDPRTVLEKGSKMQFEPGTQAEQADSGVESGCFVARGMGIATSDVRTWDVDGYRSSDSLGTDDLDHTGRRTGADDPTSDIE